MVVISVGMLGIAALYVEGLRAGRTSVYRMAAIDLASALKAAGPRAPKRRHSSTIA